MILNKIIENKDLAWDANSVNINDLYFRSRIDQNNPILIKEIINGFRKEFLDIGKGIGIIDLNRITDDFSEQKKMYIDIVNILGIMLEQNIKGEKVVEIKDIGKSMITGGRYHETKEGGSLHTDCPQWEKRPNYFGLYCVRGAMKGGEGKYLSAYSIHNELLINDPESLRILYEPFHFDKRQDVYDSNNLTVFKPIFQYDGNRLSFRYLSDYVRDGHKRVNQPLTTKQQKAIDLLDSLLKNKKFIINHHLDSGQAVFINNYRIVHGRSSYRDYHDENKKRLLLRTWIIN